MPGLLDDYVLPVHTANAVWEVPGLEAGNKIGKRLQMTQQYSQSIVYNCASCLDIIIYIGTTLLTRWLSSSTPEGLLVASCSRAVERPTRLGMSHKL